MSLFFFQNRQRQSVILRNHQFGFDVQFLFYSFRHTDGFRGDSRSTRAMFNLDFIHITFSFSLRIIFDNFLGPLIDDNINRVCQERLIENQSHHRIFVSQVNRFKSEFFVKPNRRIVRRNAQTNSRIFFFSGGQKIFEQFCSDAFASVFR